jgi:hypothetical protein
MSRGFLTTPVLYHGPTQLVGCELAPKEKELFEGIKQEIRKLLNPKEDVEVAIFNTIRQFNRTDVLGMDESMPVLEAAVKYIRHLLADVPHPTVFLHLVQLVDGLVRKSGIRAHFLVGRKKFLQTLSIRARQFKKFATDEACQDAADFTFDCMQGWHEAFFDLKSLFPHFEAVYMKLLHKYHVQFPRSDNDSSRLPILLEQCDDLAFENADPHHFLYTENINAGDEEEADNGVDYALYGEDDQFKGELSSNQPELRAIENKLNNNNNQGDNTLRPGTPSQHDDIAEHASFSPPDKKPSGRPGLQQVVSQKSFSVRRSTGANEKSSKGEMMSPVTEAESEDDNHQNTTERKENEVSTPKKNSTDNNDEDFVTIENRAVIVDGRISIDTRAVLSPSGGGNGKRQSMRFSGKVSGSHDQEDNHQHATIDADGKVRYDHYKSDKVLKSVGSHLYNQQSVRGFQNIGGKIEKFSSMDSMDSQGQRKHQSLSKSRSGNSEELDPKLEIRFFGNQRVVVAKKE